MGSPTSKQKRLPRSLLWWRHNRHFPSPSPTLPKGLISLPHILRGLHLQHPHLLVARLRKLLTPPHHLRMAATKRGTIIDRQTQLHVLSWNVCDITHCLKQSTLKDYVHQHHPDFIFIQEAFVGFPTARGRTAPLLNCYTPYVHYAWNGLITYFAIPDRLLRLRWQWALSRLGCVTSTRHQTR